MVPLLMVIVLVCHKGSLGDDPGLVTNSIDYILLTFHNQGSVLKSVFSTNAQSRFAPAVFDSVLGPPRLSRHT